MYKKQGFRFIITSSTRSLFKQRNNDKRWIITRKGRTSSGSGIIQNKNVKGSTTAIYYRINYKSFAEFAF